MQIHMPDFLRRNRWIALWLLVCVSLSGYSLYVWLTYPKFPECNANVHLNYKIGEKRLELEQSFRIAVSGWREVTVLLKGKINDGQEHFNISRLLVFRYSYADGLFHVRLKQAVKEADDSVDHKDLIHLVPPRWESSYLRVERMAGNRYLLTDKNAVMLVCTAT